MAKVQIVLPKMGESVMEGTILQWLKKPGDRVEEDEPILEVATDKVDTEIPSSHEGILVEWLVKEGDVVEVGAPIAVISIGAAEEITHQATAPQPIFSENSNSQNDSSTKTEPVVIQAAAEVETQIQNTMNNIQNSPSPTPVQGLWKLSQPISGRFYSPLVMNIAREESIGMAELEYIPGTGSEGRVTKKDILDYLEAKKSNGNVSTATVATPVSVTTSFPVETAKDFEPAPSTSHFVEETEPLKHHGVVEREHYVPPTPPQEVSTTSLGFEKIAETAKTIKEENPALFTPPVSQPTVEPALQKTEAPVERVAPAVSQPVVQEVKASPVVTTSAETSKPYSSPLFVPKPKPAPVVEEPVSNFTSLPRVTAEGAPITSPYVDSSPKLPAARESELAKYKDNPDFEIIQMDRMRKMIAERMLHSVYTSPHVASYVEADVTNMVYWKNRVKTAYKNKHGDTLTFTPIFIEAVTKALRDYPMINISVEGDVIIKKKKINVGMAVALPSGNLIVPVIREADEKNLVGLTKSVNDFAKRARNAELTADDLQDGTFTISNIGSFGSVMGTPIIVQPQVAILAIGTIQKKPAVVETPAGDAISIRHRCMLSLSYDHRVVDGALGSSFLRRVADYLESFDVGRDF